jgi:hypothetical protein
MSVIVTLEAELKEGGCLDFLSHRSVKPSLSSGAFTLQNMLYF